MVGNKFKTIHTTTTLYEGVGMDHRPHSLPCMGTMNCDQSWTRKR